MNNNSGVGIAVGIAAGIFGFLGVAFKLYANSKNNTIKFIESSKTLKEATPDDHNIVSVNYSTILESDNPIELDKNKWLYVISKKYNVTSTHHVAKQDISLDDYLINSYDSKEYEHVKTQVYDTKLNQKNGIQVDNLMPIIHNKYAVETRLFKPCDTSKEEPGIVEKILGTNVTKTSNSIIVDMKPQFIGNQYYRTGIPDDKQQYLIIGNFNGREFVIDDKLIIEKNKNIDTLTDEIRSTRNKFTLLSTGSFIAGGVLFAVFTIPSRL